MANKSIQKYIELSRSRRRSRDGFEVSRLEAQASYHRVRPNFGIGFGYGAETDLTHGFGLVSATAKVQ